MTPEEALKYIEKWYQPTTGPEEREKAIKALSVIIKSINEIRKYRAIGTVEECRGGAMEKQIPKKPNRSGMDEQDYYVCPNCGADIGSIDDYFPRDGYCHECGQAIDNENLEGMEDEYKFR